METLRSQHKTKKVFVETRAECDKSERKKALIFTKRRDERSTLTTINFNTCNNVNGLV